MPQVEIDPSNSISAVRFFISRAQQKCLARVIHGSDAAATPTDFAELISDDFQSRCFPGRKHELKIHLSAVRFRPQPYRSKAVECSKAAT
jgi:hypothetical protein